MRNCSTKSKTCSKTDLQVGERLDRIGFGELTLIQHPDDFCYGVDAVILADFAASLCKPERAADLGSGSGILLLILSHKTRAEKLMGVEVQDRLAERARRSFAENSLEDRIEMLSKDVLVIPERKALHGFFDLVVSNPPYVRKSAGIPSRESSLEVARHETSAELSDFIRAAGLMLGGRGNFCMVHRPERLADICVLCRENRLEPKHLRFVSPDKNKAPNMLLLHCVKGGGNGMRCLPPLYVYEETGGYTKEIQRIYERDAEVK